MGIRFKKNTNILYVADAFQGIIKIDVDKGSKSLVIGANDTRFGALPMRLVNDIDMDGDMVYFIDSSTKIDVNDAVTDILESFSLGRLFQLNENTNELTLLSDNLYFPNGLQLLSPSNDAILVNECTIATISK